MSKDTESTSENPQPLATVGLAEFNEWVKSSIKFMVTVDSYGLLGAKDRVVTAAYAGEVQHDAGKLDSKTNPEENQAKAAVSWMKESSDVFYGVDNGPVEAMQKCVDMMKKYFFEELNGQRVPVR